MNTKFLTLFAAILIYFTLSPDIESENAKLVDEIRLIEHKLTSDQNTDELMKKTSELVRTDRHNDKTNQTLFISSDIPEALAFASLQQTIKDDVNATNVEITNLSWGEPSSKEDSPYTLLPVTIAFKGTAKNCGEFLNRLQHHSKLIYIENLSVVQYLDSLSLVADLYTYQLKKPVANDEATR